MQVRKQQLELDMEQQTAWQSTPIFLPGESHEQRSLEGYGPWGLTESDMTEET